MGSKEQGAGSKERGAEEGEVSRSLCLDGLAVGQHASGIDGASKRADIDVARPERVLGSRRAALNSTAKKLL